MHVKHRRCYAHVHLANDAALENPFLEQDTLYGEAMTVASEPFARVNSLQFFLGLAELCCVHAQPVSMAVQMLR